MGMVKFINNCSFKKDIKLNDLEYSYDPFPNQSEIFPNVLNDFLKNQDAGPYKDNQETIKSKHKDTETYDRSKKNDKSFF